MDVISLFFTSIPAYFILGPLVVIIITLVVLAAHRDSKNPASGEAVLAAAPVTQVTPSTPVVVPAKTTPANPVLSTIPTPVLAPTRTAPVIEQQMITPQAPVAVKPTMPTPVTPMTPPLPKEMPIANPVPAADPVVSESVKPAGAVPPLSSWKPVEPIVMPQENLGKSETSMQEAATMPVSTPDPAPMATVPPTPPTPTAPSTPPVASVTPTTPAPPTTV